MARPPHTLVTFEGSMGGAAGIETFSFSVRTLPLASNTQSTLSAAAISAMGACTAGDGLWQYVGDNVVLKKVTVARVNGDGNWITRPDGSYEKAEWNGSIPGQVAGGSNLPAQSALCISLVTARPGPTGKGRFFLPLGKATLDGDGRLQASEMPGRAANAALFVERIGNTVAEVEVFSSKDYSSTVTGVKVGRVVDTMRSRRRSLVEAYTAALRP
jgi:hypothetical protein